jgi:ribonuclease T1
MRGLRLVAGLLLAAALAFPLAAVARATGLPATMVAADLPAEARQTLALIRHGGPFPYKRDGVVFGNYEKRLPPRHRGYYHEYTVPTPSVRNRGARRIIAGEGSGGDVRSSGEYYYSDDHYRSFHRIAP